MARLLEHQVKDILQGEGFIIPARRLCHTPDEVRAACVELGAPVYVKAQVLAGDRAAGGGVRRCESPDDAAAAAQALLGSQVQGLTVDSLLVESATVGQWEGYASVALEENPPRRVLRFSRTGGAGFDPSQATVQLDLVDAVEAVRKGGGVPVCVAAVADRTGGKVDFGGLPFFAATDVVMESYEAEACPLCQAGVPLKVT